jgi:multiple sugar transport system ATP-binding protein
MDGGAKLLVAVRPEHVQVGSGPLSATVTLTEQLGRDYLVHLTAGTSLIRALVPASAAAVLAPGDEIAFHVDPANLHLFDSESGQRVEIDLAGVRSPEPMETAEPAASPIRPGTEH